MTCCDRYLWKSSSPSSKVNRKNGSSSSVSRTDNSFKKIYCLYQLRTVTIILKSFFRLNGILCRGLVGDLYILYNIEPFINTTREPLNKSELTILKVYLQASLMVFYSDTF